MGRLLKSLTIGGIFGFIAGLLFAPTKGEETRKKVQDAVAQGKVKFQEIKEELSKKKVD